MCEGCVEKPLYLLIAEWMMAENRWVIAREISIHFDIEHSKAVNTRDKLVGVRETPRIPAVPLTELNREQKWQMMLSKSMRR